MAPYLKPLHLLLCLSWLASATPSNELKLVGYGNSSLGIEVQVLSSSQNSKLQVNQQIYSKTIPGVYFPFQCGQKYYALNCGRLTALNEGNIGSLTVIIVPMESGILLTRMTYDNKTDALQLSGEHVINVPLCEKPLAIVQAEDVPTAWMVCINGNTVHFFKMTVDLTILANSNVVGPLAQYALSNVPTHLSNVIVATVWEEDSLFFAVDDTILQVSFEEQVIYKISYSLCSYITVLQNGDGILHAYCDDNSMQYLSTDGELIMSLPPPPAPAVLVPCMNVPNVQLVLFAKVPSPYITYKVMGANSTRLVELGQWVADLDSWECFGSGDAIHFVFTDNLLGVIVVMINLEAQCMDSNCADIMVLDSTPCANKCKPLIVLNERWVVLERVANVGDLLFRVFDCFSNFSTVIEANHIHVNFYTLLEYPLLSSPAISASTMVSSSSLPTQPVEVSTEYEESYKTALYATVVTVAVVFIVVVVGGIMVCAVLRFRPQLLRRGDKNEDKVQLVKHKTEYSFPVQVSPPDRDVLISPVQETGM